MSDNSPAGEVLVNAALSALRHHVSGAVARGDAVSITGIEAGPPPRDYRWQRWTDAQIEAFISERETDGDEETEDLIERMRDELEAREEYRAGHADTPSLQDNGRTLGSYGELWAAWKKLGGNHERDDLSGNGEVRSHSRGNDRSHN